MNLFDFFPKPSYLKISAVGFDISDQSLKYAEFYRKKNAIHLVNFGKKEIAGGIIESGQIKKPEEFTSFLKSFRKDIKNNYVVVALPEEKIFIGAAHLPLMKEGEVRESLALQLEEHIPLQAKETIFDFEISADEKIKGHMDAYFSATTIELAKSYRDVLIAADFIPLVFETEPHALARVFIRSGEKSSQMIIDFGKTRTTFIIVNGQRVEFSSTIKIAGGAIDAAIAKALSVGIEEGNSIKNKIGLIKNQKNESVFEIILPLVSMVKNEASKHLAYWRTYASQYIVPNPEVEKIILCGGDSNLKGLPEYLSSELHLPVALGNPWINIASFEERIPEIEFREALMYATAIGLALRTV